MAIDVMILLDADAAAIQHCAAATAGSSVPLQNPMLQIYATNICISILCHFYQSSLLEEPKIQLLCTCTPIIDAPLGARKDV